MENKSQVPNEGLSDHDREMMEVPAEEEVTPPAEPKKGWRDKLKEGHRKYREGLGLSPDSEKPTWVDLSNKWADEERKKLGGKEGEPIFKSFVMKALGRRKNPPENPSSTKSQ